MSKYADKRTQRIELTHPHSPAVSWCRKCFPSYQPPAPRPGEEPVTVEEVAGDYEPDMPEGDYHFKHQSPAPRPGEEPTEDSPGDAEPVTSEADLGRRY